MKWQPGDSNNTLKQADELKNQTTPASGADRDLELTVDSNEEEIIETMHKMTH